MRGPTHLVNKSAFSVLMIFTVLLFYLGSSGGKAWKKFFRPFFRCCLSSIANLRSSVTSKLFPSTIQMKFYLICNGLQTIAYLFLLLTDAHFIVTVLYFQVGPLSLSLKCWSLHNCPFAYVFYFFINRRTVLGGTQMAFLHYVSWEVSLIQSQKVLNFNHLGLK